MFTILILFGFGLFVLTCIISFLRGVVVVFSKSGGGREGGGGVGLSSMTYMHLANQREWVKFAEQNMRNDRHPDYGMSVDD